jgi:mRNA interferase HigB
LREHWEKPGRHDSETPLKTWFDVAKAANWTSHQSLKEAFGANVDLAHGRYVFDIGGNKYRLICRIDFRRRAALTLWVGTHAEYDNLCANGGVKPQQL